MTQPSIRSLVLWRFTKSCKSDDPKEQLWSHMKGSYVYVTPPFEKVRWLAMVPYNDPEGLLWSRK